MTLNKYMATLLHSCTVPPQMVEWTNRRFRSLDSKYVWCAQVFTTTTAHEILQPLLPIDGKGRYEHRMLPRLMTLMQRTNHTPCVVVVTAALARLLRHASVSPATPPAMVPIQDQTTHLQVWLWTEQSRANTCTDQQRVCLCLDQLQTKRRRSHQNSM